MPIYEYRCIQCSKEFEAKRPMSQATEPAPCPHCGGQGTRLLSAIASSNTMGLMSNMIVPSGRAFRGEKDSGEVVEEGQRGALVHEFRCAKCGDVFRVRRSAGATEQPANCPRCGGAGELLRVIAGRPLRTEG